jgi:hypothetical protein
MSSFFLLPGGFTLTGFVCAEGLLQGMEEFLEEPSSVAYLCWVLPTGGAHTSLSDFSGLSLGTGMSW